MARTAATTRRALPPDCTTTTSTGATHQRRWRPRAGQAELLESALTGSGVGHTLEFYPARHGFAVADNPTYDTEADARHWAALRQLYLARL